MEEKTEDLRGLVAQVENTHARDYLMAVAMRAPEYLCYQTAGISKQEIQSLFDNNVYFRETLKRLINWEDTKGAVQEWCWSRVSRYLLEVESLAFTKDDRKGRVKLDALQYLINLGLSTGGTVSKSLSVMEEYATGGGKKTVTKTIHTEG